MLHEHHARIASPHSGRQAPDLRLLLRNTGPVADCCGLAGSVRPELEEALSLDSTVIGS